MASETELGAMPVHAGLTPRPVSLPPLNGFDLKARYQADRCSGDFFDAVMAGSRVIFLLTDIAGSRAETHPIAAKVQEVFRTKAQELFESPGANESESIALLTRDVNRSVIDAAEGARFAPAFLGCFNMTVSVLTYLNAGAMTAVFRDAEGVRVLESGGIPLGLFTHNTYEPAVLAFEPGAKLLLVTKGVTGSRRGSATFGADRVREELEGANTDSALVICEDVLREASEFNDHPWSLVYDLLHPGKRQCRDDMTAVALVRPGHPIGQSI
jgi:serine phosphatase RsbU (regulator of sigma subunit)